MKHLYHAANHLSDLIEQERLTLEIESDKLNCFGISLICHSKSVLINIHVLICRHIHHISLRCSFRGLYLFSIVMVLLGAFKIGP
jgi:hypothetical protein